MQLSVLCTAFPPCNMNQNSLSALDQRFPWSESMVRLLIYTGGKKFLDKTSFSVKDVPIKGWKQGIRNSRTPPPTEGWRPPTQCTCIRSLLSVCTQQSELGMQETKERPLSFLSRWCS